MLLASVLWALIGVGVGALVRNQVGAIVGVLVFTQFLEPIGRTAAAFVDGLSGATKYLRERRATPWSARASTASRRQAPRRRTAWNGGRAGSCLLGYAVVFVVLGHLVSWRRDVS